MAGCCWMVSQHLLLSTPPNHVPLNFSSALISSTPLSFSLGSGSRSRVRGRASARARATRTSNALSVSASSTLQALIFDCDGVILESEDLHRRAYNDAFSHFNVRCPSSPSQHPLNWDSHFYDQLQNRIGGGKPKMRWYFKEYGWPSSTVFDTPPEDDGDRAKLIDILQVPFFDSSDDLGSIWLLINCRKGNYNFLELGFSSNTNTILIPKYCCSFSLEGDDVKEKKPDPSIYQTAVKRLGVSEKDCLVVEDSVIGLQAATGAGMSCVITYTSSTADQDFKDAIAIYPDLSNVRLKDLELLLQNVVPAK
eukprot:XP_010646823.1 PREDICTED: haloacid dehalogenase-like hydrolase domain-containing protein At4g39970 [Vitis vinifera]